MEEVCVITGGGSGMGLAAAKFMPKDKIIVVSGRTEKKLLNAVAELEALGYKAYAKSCDTSGRAFANSSCSNSAIVVAFITFLCSFELFCIFIERGQFPALAFGVFLRFVFEFHGVIIIAAVQNDTAFIVRFPNHVEGFFRTLRLRNDRPL